MNARKWVPIAVVGLAAVLVVAKAVPPSPPTAGPDLNAFGRIPVQYQGRFMPLDTVARHHLLVISGGRETYTAGQNTEPAIRWMLEVMSGKDGAVNYKVIRIDSPDVRQFLALGEPTRIVALLPGGSVGAAGQAVGRRPQDHAEGGERQTTNGLRLERVIQDSGKPNPTLRDFMEYTGRGTLRELPLFVGTPRQVADQMEAWLCGGACDGFVLAATHMPGAYEDFVRLVVPELQRRGLFQSDYTGYTLRENLGLPYPAWGTARGK